MVVVGFFFQAEDGIRDYDVTGVQTCALPIYQAIQFNETIGLTGITMTKLDGGGRGGILLAIADQIGRASV